MTDDQIISLAETHGATHKQSLGVYQFFKDELLVFSRELIAQEVTHEVQTDREQEGSL